MPKARISPPTGAVELYYEETGSGTPLIWCHEFGGGRAFYTGGGHTKESYADPDFQKHLVGAIRWAAGQDK